MNYTCEIACTKESLRTLRDFIKKSLAGHVNDPLELASMVLAMDEICANLIIHAHKCNAHDHLEIEIEVKDRNGIFFRIFDEQEIFDFSSYQSPTLEELIKTQRKGGLGLNLVKKIMDDIKIRQEKGKNCCCMYKKVDVH